MTGILYTLKSQMKKDLVTMFDTVVFLCQNESWLLQLTVYRHKNGTKEFVLSMAEDKLQAEIIREIKDCGYLQM